MQCSSAGIKSGDIQVGWSCWSDLKRTVFIGNYLKRHRLYFRRKYPYTYFYGTTACTTVGCVVVDVATGLSFLFFFCFLSVFIAYTFRK